MAAALGPWLVRLSLAVGPLHIAQRTGAEELHGYSGLSRRGTYDRLLIGEWAVADELPDEFDRRAAMGEHLFLEPDRRDPAGAARSVAVFDCGPDQLGTPRLAHIALAVVLARRAARPRVPFAIVDLAGDEVWPWEGASTVRRLLACRTDRRVSSATWAERLRGEPDAWLVGLGDWRGPAVRVHPSPGRLRVEIRTPRAHVEVALDLPPEPLGVRCLREPWRRIGTVTAPATGVATTDLRFSADERRLLVARSDGRLVAFNIPNSPKAVPGHPRVLQASDARRIRAAGWYKRWVWLEDDEDGVVRPRHWNATREGFPAERRAFHVPGRLPSPLVVRGDTAVWPETPDGPSRLWSWDRGAPRLLAEQSAALSPGSHSTILVLAEVNGRRTPCHVTTDGLAPLPGGDLGPGPWWAAWSNSGDVLVQRDDGSWMVRTAKGAVSTLGGPQRPIGWSNGRWIAVHGPAVLTSDGSHPYCDAFVAEDDIRDAVASPRGLVAVRTLRGGVRVWSLHLGALLLQVEP